MRVNVLFSAPVAYKGQYIFLSQNREKQSSNYWKICIKTKNYIVPKILLSCQPVLPTVSESTCNLKIMVVSFN